MTRPLALFLIPAALFLAGCPGGAIIVEDPGSSDDTAFDVLVDASKDGGAWWFPQGGDGDPDEPHQGKALVDYLESLGVGVTELGRNRLVTPALLESNDLVIRASGYFPYLDSELDAYEAYVADGGQLLLLAEHRWPGQSDQVAEVFGIEFAGITRGNNILQFVAEHPITRDTETYAIRYGVGSGIVDLPAGAIVLATVDDGTYLDLDRDEVQDEDEQSAPPVMGILDPEDGVVVFLGDTNTLEAVPQPLVDNLMGFFFDGANRRWAGAR